MDRGYTSDSEVYAEHSKARIPRSTTDMDVASSGWLVVSARTCTCTCAEPTCTSQSECCLCVPRLGKMTWR